MTGREVTSGTAKVAVSLIALSIGIAAGPAWAAPGSESARYAEEAQKLSTKGDVAAAIIQLKNAVRADADNSEARYQLALLYLRSGDPGSAQRELESARARGFDDTKIVTPLSQAYLQQGRFSDLIRTFDPEKYKGAARVDVLVAKARAHIGLGDTANARKLVDIAITEAPEQPSVLVADANVRRASGDIKGAEAQIDKALAKEPDQVDSLLFKGDMRQLQGDREGALAIFNKAVEKAPQYSRARLSRALANLSAGRFDAVNTDITPVLAVESHNAVAIYLRAFLIAKAGNFKEAGQLLISTPNVIENYAPARYLLASVALANNNLETAVSNAEQYLSKVPQDVNGAKLLGTIYLRMNAAPKAVQVLEPLAGQLKDDAQFKLRLAEAYMSVGRGEEAIKLFREGVDADPSNENARLALAVNQIRSGATDKGVDELQKLIASKPGAVQANAVLILTHLQNGANDKALAAANAMVKSDPNAQAYNLQGTVYLADGKLDAARTAYTTALEKDPKFVAAALNLARVQEKAKDAAGAEAWYNKALAIDPKNATAFEGLAAQAMARQDRDGAVKHLDRAIELNPKVTRPRVQLVQLLLDRKENSRALIAARAFANDMPDDPMAIDALARTQHANGDYTNAIGTYQRLTTMMPANAEIHRRLGVAYAAAGKRLEARSAFDQAIALAPDMPQSLIDRVNIERELNGMDQAVTLATKLVAERPESTSRQLVLGDVQLSAGKNEAALATYRKVWAKAPDGRVVERMNLALNRVGKPDEGFTMLKDFAAKNPSDYQVRYIIASSYITTGKNAEALAELEAMDGALPDNPLLLNNIAWLYGQNGNPRAVEAGEKALRLSPQSADIMDTLGWIHVNQGDAKRGNELLAKAVAAAPDRPEFAYHYAAALKRTGNAARAKDVLGHALGVKTSFAERPKAEALLKELGG